MKILQTLSIMVFVLSLSACGVTGYESGVEQGAVLTSIDLTESGSEISSSEALKELNEYCLNQDSILKMKNYAFNAGYAEHFEGSGYSGFLASKAETEDKCIAPTNNGEMYSQNGMGMYPPSSDSCLNDIYKSTCDVLIQSLEGVGGYASVRSKTNTSASGVAAGITVNQENCLTFDLTESRRGYAATVAFCGDAFISTATASDGVSQDNKMALYLYR